MSSRDSTGPSTDRQPRSKQDGSSKKPKGNKGASAKAWNMPKERAPPSLIDPQLFEQCKRFVNKVDNMLEKIFIDEHLAPVNSFNVPSNNVPTEYLSRLERHWFERKMPIDNSTEAKQASAPFTGPSTMPLDSDDKKEAQPLPIPQAASQTPTTSCTTNPDAPDQTPCELQPEQRSDTTAGIATELLDALNVDENLSWESVIPVELLPNPTLPDDVDSNQDPLYQRLVRGLVFTLQHPRGIKTDGDTDFNPTLSLNRFGDAITAYRRDRNDEAPVFRTLCIVWTNKRDVIPVFYGHSAWRMGVERFPERSEKTSERGFREALISDSPLTADELKSAHWHDIEQCAEHLALPFAYKAAKRYLADGKGDTIIIFSLALKYEGNTGRLKPAAFCQNCRKRAEKLANEATGVRIVDVVNFAFPYESKETAALFNKA